LRYLPPYSPNLNPIEEAFSKNKAFCARLRPARRTLIEALGPALLAITKEDAQGFFEYCG
jgi:transposase